MNCVTLDFLHRNLYIHIKTLLLFEFSRTTFAVRERRDNWVCGRDKSQ